jgi:hypothetical protein
MASEKQRKAARRNVKKAQAGAKKKQTLKKADSSTLGTLRVYGEEILPRLRSE